MRQWVTVVAFIRVYDPDTRSWFCDIDMDIGEAYLPFVRPALMRYQPHEWPGCVLSRILLANIVQTLPDRTLTWRRTRCSGAAADHRPRAHLHRNPPGRRASFGWIGARPHGRPPKQRGAAIPDDLLDWRAVDGAEVELTHVLSGSTATWSGRLTLPAGDGPQRRSSWKKST